jgi:enoyl-CoA hydratase/carnithine racemase
VESALVAESSTYSMLQASSEHQDWLARREPPKSTRDASTNRVRLERDGNELTVTLDRGEAHNAFDRHMRDGLCEALEVAMVDPSIERVHLRGSGPSFCSGGDLHEFGSAGDPAEAHRVRLTRSAARLLARLSDRTDVAIHGHTYGSGIELAAFASRVVAHRDTSIALPELGLGLVPGAGGTASIPRRIGRHRTMELALRQDPLDAPTALSWGLVDAIE